MDRLTSMAVFVAAAEQGSLSGAARRFGLSASMAGKHVSAIEAELKVRLMQRSTRQLSLTEAGQTYLVRCKRILEQIDEANREANATQQAVRGVLRVAAPLTFGALHLGNVTASYLAAYPEVNVEMLLSDRYVDLLADGIDVAIRIGRLHDSDLVAKRLAPCRMVFCAAPAFCQRYSAPITIDALRTAPRLVFSDVVSAGDWSLLAADGSTQQIDGPVRMSSNNMQMLLATALAGGGIAYGPSFVFGQHIARGELIWAIHLTPPVLL